MGGIVDADTKLKNYLDNVANKGYIIRKADIEKRDFLGEAFEAGKLPLKLLEESLGGPNRFEAAFAKKKADKHAQFVQRFGKNSGKVKKLEKLGIEIPAENLLDSNFSSLLRFAKGASDDTIKDLAKSSGGATSMMRAYQGGTIPLQAYENGSGRSGTVQNVTSGDANANATLNFYQSGNMNPDDVGRVVRSTLDDLVMETKIHSGNFKDWN